MTLPAPTYDLVLMLDAEVEEAARTKILGEARDAIAAQGELLRDDDWGDRALTYPINHKATAKYHLLQFHAAGAELLAKLDRSLRIADEVVRFRIVKLKPGTPEAPHAPTASVDAPGAVAPTASVAVTPAGAPVETEAAAVAPAVAPAVASAEPGAAAVATPVAAQPVQAEPEAAQPAPEAA